MLTQKPLLNTWNIRIFARGLTRSLKYLKLLYCSKTNLKFNLTVKCQLKIKILFLKKNKNLMKKFK